MRLFWTRTCAVVSVLCGVVTPATAQHTVPTEQQDVICPHGDPADRLVVATDGLATPRILLRDDGTLELSDPEASKPDASQMSDLDGLSFCYAEGERCQPSTNPQQVVLRVDRISPRGVRELICKKIDVGATYVYPLDKTGSVVRHGDILSWVVFGRAQGPHHKDVATDFPARLSRLKQLETELVKEAPSRILHLIDPAYVKEAKAYVGNRGVEPRPIDPLDVQNMRAKWGCNTAPLKTRHAEIEKHFAWNAICGKLNAFERAINSVSAQSPAANVSSYADVLEVMGEPPDATEFCEKVAKHRWIEAESSLVRRAAFEVPFSRNIAEIKQVIFDSGTSAPLDLDPETQPLLLLADVPTGQSRIKLHPQFDGASMRDGGVTLAQFALNVASFGVGKGLVGFDTATFKLVNTLPPARQAELDEFLCPAALKFDPELPTRAKVGTRAGRVSEKLGERKLTLKVCSGSTCDEPKDDKPGTVTNTVLFRPKRGWAPFIMAGLGASAMEGEYKLEQVTTGTGPDDIYELTRETVDVAPSVDLLLGFPLRSFAALFVGPALVAKNYDLLHLWKAGLALRHPQFSKYVYLLLHITGGLREEVSDPKLNQRWAVASDAKAPSLLTEQRIVWGAGVSLGIDIELLGSAADGVFKKITGAGE